MKFKFPIILSTVLVAILLLIVHGAMVFYVSASEIQLELRNRAVKELYQLGRSHQRVVEHLYSENGLADVQSYLSTESVDSATSTVILDARGRRLAGSADQFGDKTLIAIEFGIAEDALQNLMSLSRMSSSRQMLWSDDEQKVLLIKPLKLTRIDELPAADNVGLLLIEQDLSWIKSRVSAVLKKQQLFLWLGYLAFVGVLAVVIYRSVIRRVKHISNLAERISAGDRSLRVDDSGTDEIGFLARFFNEMLDNMEAHQFVLSNAFDEISHRERNLTLTLQSIGDAVIVTDADGSVTRMNPVACLLTGWEELESVGKSLDEVFNIVDSNTGTKLKNPVTEVMRRHEVIELGEHTTLISRSGKKYHIADSAAPIKDQQGVIYGVIMVFQDITEEYSLQQALRESEQRLRMALQATDEGLWDWDIKTDNVYYSERWISMLDYSYNDVVPDISFWKNNVHQDDKAEVMEKLRQHLDGILPQFESEHRIRKGDGSYLWVRGRGKVTEYDVNGKPARMVGTASDISTEKEHEDHMRRAQKMEAMGKLTGGIAHDYNNMLGVILGYAELLQMKLGSDPKQSTYIESILRAAERAKKLTNGLLKFSRRKDTAAKAADINSLINEDADMLSRTLTAKVELNLDLFENLWTVLIDVGDLEDAILNMSINAMHAMPNGGTLAISTRNVTLTDDDARVLGLEHGDYVCLSIEDSGEGMDEETVERIFDPFFSTKGDQGTGLGLSQVYGFISRSRGGIKVVSAPRLGTRFEMYFPRHDHADAVSDAVEHVEVGSFEGNETIMVVDDEAALRSLSEEILANNGYKVLLAKDAFDALRILEHDCVDLVLTDVIMPGMNGYQLARQIRHKYPNVKIQTVSGFNSLEDDLEVDEKLRKGQISKPFTANELLHRVRSLLDSGAVV